MITAFLGKNIVDLDFITGIELGIEVFTGDDAAEDDLFAITFDFLILRITYIRKR